MHGAGNDYIYVDTTQYPISHPEELARAWSAPHTGIGSDGLVLIGSSDKADFSMRIFNADGSEARMCGNASRCIGKYLFDTMLGRKLLNWFNSQGLNVEILGEFDDAALMKAFGAMHNAIFVAPTLYAYDFYADKTVVEIGRVENVMEEYHAIFAERMIQHPAVQRICNTDYSALFSPAAR